MLTTNATTGTMSIIGFRPAGNIGVSLGKVDSYTATPTAIHTFSSAKHQEAILTKQ